MKIGLAIPHYGDNEHLDKLLKSLNTIENVDLSLIINVYDDNKTKYGFTKSSNMAISGLLDKNVDWIWLLNNDTTVPKQTLSAMSRILADSEPCIYGFQIRMMDNPDTIHHGGTVQCFPNGIHKSGSVKLNNLNKRTKERWVTFASVLIHIDIIKKIGLLDENMRMIFSDSDYCYRARLAGYNVYYEPKFVIYHKVGESMKPSNTNMEAIFYNDMINFRDKWIIGKKFFDLDKEVL